MTRLFGVQIAGGFSSEARVFAGLLARRDDDIRARVLVHRDPTNPAAVLRFADMAGAEILPYDSGWRASRWGRPLQPGRLPVVGRYLLRLSRSAALAKEFDPEVVYSSQQNYDSRTATRIARDLDIPQIIHFHWTFDRHLRGPVAEWLKQVDCVIAVSDFIRDHAIENGVRPERIAVVRNTMTPMPDVDAAEVEAVRRSLGLPDDVPVFGMVGRLDDGKGHLDAIAAVEAAAQKLPDARLVIVGSGHDQAEIMARAASSPERDRIHFTGQRNDVPVLLAMFDGLLHPATDDPCPLAVLEAMAAGVPVIAYDQGGPRELVSNGDTGLLVLHRSVNELAEAMVTLAGDESMRSRMAEASTTRIRDEFRPEDAGRAFSAAVRAVASGAPLS